MYSEADLLPISALQHLAYCERQWGLIHLEQAWQENRLTAEGRLLHEHAHDQSSEARGDLRIARGLRLRSLRLGLSGIADVVEFHRLPANDGGVALEGVAGTWRPFIVEYKRGRPKLGQEDRVQLCAQALSLEEMLGTTIPSSAFFYGRPQRRCDVDLSEALRQQTKGLAARLHQLTSAGKTPAAEYSPKCVSCSLSGPCMPRATDGSRSVRKYMHAMLRETITAT